MPAPSLPPSVRPASSTRTELAEFVRTLLAVMSTLMVVVALIGLLTGAPGWAGLRLGLILLAALVALAWLRQTQRAVKTGPDAESLGGVPGPRR